MLNDQQIFMINTVLRQFFNESQCISPSAIALHILETFGEEISEDAVHTWMQEEMQRMQDARRSA
jgi:hypothetical protein